MNKNDAKLVYDTLLSAPGMNEPVKIDFRISRTQVLFLSQIILKGLSLKDGHSDLLSTVSNETADELRFLSASFLEKAGLTDMNHKLESLQIQ